LPKLSRGGRKELKETKSKIRSTLLVNYERALNEQLRRTNSRHKKKYPRRILEVFKSMITYRNIIRDAKTMIVDNKGMDYIDKKITDVVGLNLAEAPNEQLVLCVNEDKLEALDQFMFLYSSIFIDLVQRAEPKMPIDYMILYPSQAFKLSKEKLDMRGLAKVSNSVKKQMDSELFTLQSAYAVLPRRLNPDEDFVRKAKIPPNMFTRMITTMGWSVADLEEMNVETRGVFMNFLSLDLVVIEFGRKPTVERIEKMGITGMEEFDSINHEFLRIYISMSSGIIYIQGLEDVEVLEGQMMGDDIFPPTHAFFSEILWCIEFIYEMNKAFQNKVPVTRVLRRKHRRGKITRYNQSNVTKKHLKNQNPKYAYKNPKTKHKTPSGKWKWNYASMVSEYFRHYYYCDVEDCGKRIFKSGLIIICPNCKEPSWYMNDKCTDCESVLPKLMCFSGDEPHEMVIRVEKTKIKSHTRRPDLPERDTIIVTK